MGSLAARLVRAGPVEPGRVSRMLEAAPHRGHRHTVREHGSAVLGVSAHEGAVDDASISSGNGLVAAFSGVLDNRDELIRELAGAGHPPPGGDTAADVLEAALRAWGDAAPGRLRGQFAAAVSDGRQLWCFRDQVGFHAIYYHEDGDGMQVASEAKQVLAGAGITREPDVEVV